MGFRKFALAWLVLVGACSSQTPPSEPPGGYRLYVSNEISGDLSVIDPASRREISRIRLGKRPRGLAPSPDGRLLYIALSGSPIGVVTTFGSQPIARINSDKVINGCRQTKESMGRCRWSRRNTNTAGKNGSM